jgi:transcriptional regulator with XRE-family HTH domain
MHIHTNGRKSNISVAEYFTLLRERAGLTQVELAELTGISNTHISNVENGRRLYSLELLETVTTALLAAAPRN